MHLEVGRVLAVQLARGEFLELEWSTCEESTEACPIDEMSSNLLATCPAPLGSVQIHAATRLRHLLADLISDPLVAHRFQRGDGDGLGFVIKRWAVASHAGSHRNR